MEKHILSGSLTYAEYYSLTRTYWLYSLNQNYLKRFSFNALIVGLAIIVIYNLVRDDGMKGVLFLATLYLGWLLGFYFNFFIPFLKLKETTKQAYDKFYSQDNNNSLEFNDDGIIYSEKHALFNIGWHTITRIVEFKDHILIFGDHLLKAPLIVKLDKTDQEQTAALRFAKSKIISTAP